MTSLTQLFCVYRVPVYFQTLISKITEQRQNFPNSDRNEDAEINNSNRSLAKILHLSALDGRCSKEGFLRYRQCPGDVCPDGSGARLFVQR